MSKVVGGLFTRKASTEPEAAPRDRAILDFIDKGNTFNGDPQIVGQLALITYGRGATVEVGRNVILRNLRISIEGGGRVTIADGAQLRGLLRVEKGSHVTIGARTVFNRACRISATEGASITIGTDCLFSDATIRTSDLHSIIDKTSGRRLNPPRSVVIESRVWLGEQSSIMRGVRVGTGSIIGAGSIVTKAVPTYSSAAGVPARVLRSDISWKRERLPVAVEPAMTLPVEAYDASPASLRQLALDQRFEDILHLVDRREADGGKPLEGGSTSLRWYAALAMYRTGQQLDRARTLLEKLVVELPDHKAARSVLNRLAERKD